MKLSKILLFVLIILVGLGLTITEAEARSGQRYSSSHDFDQTCVDSTAEIVTETDSLVGTNLAPIFYFSDVEYATITGIMEMYIYSMDSNVCDITGAVTPDTAKDSVQATLYTAWSSQLVGNSTGYNRASESWLLMLSFITPGVGTAKIERIKFAVPADSAIGDVLYWRLKSYYTHPNNTDSTSITYRVGVSLNAR